MLILAGDVGGTNTRLSLSSLDADNHLKTIREEVYPSGNDGLGFLVNTFLGSDPKPEKACFALAGPVINNRCKLTNLKWSELDGSSLELELGIPRVALINDFVAIAYSIVFEENKNLLTLQEGEFMQDAPILIMGAGTGLGKAFAIPQGNSFQVFPTEGGHQNFAPFNEVSLQLLRHIYLNELIDVEKVVSGPGITSIFKFLQNTKFQQEDSDSFLLSTDPSFAIAKGALQGNTLCRETMELFIEAYGSAVGDAIVSLLPFGGVYIAGGIAAQNTELISSGIFVNALKQKSRVNPDLLEKVPVHIVLNTLEGLRGAVRYAQYKI